jgi:hypothetical protein
MSPKAWLSLLVIVLFEAGVLFLILWSCGVF